MIARWFRRALKHEGGFSLAETMVVVAILSLVPVVFGNTLITLQRGVNTASGGTQRNDAVRLAVAEIDRQIRSGNVFYNPSAENDAANGIVANYSLRVYTQANAPTMTPGNRCVQWRINTSKQLQTRWWQPGSYASTKTDWRIVADDIVNRVNNTPAFTLDPTVGYGSRLIKIALVSDRTDDGSSRPQEVDASVTGRNTQYGYPNNVCDYP